MKKMPIQSLPTVLSIAGSDSCAGAGLQADLKTIHALGGYALTVPTAITAQNSLGVSAVYPLPAEVVKAQLEALFSDYQIQAIKIVMLGNLAILKTVIHCLKQYPSIPIILDPVLISSSGRPLLEAEALPLFINELLPLARLVTPNVPELNVLLGLAPNSFVGQAVEMPEIAQALFGLGVQNAVIKGGHSVETEAIDYLLMPNEPSPNQVNIHTYSSIRLESSNTHGTGCTYASAIATEIAKGKTLPQAVESAKAYLFKALLNAPQGQPKQIMQPVALERPRKGGLLHLDLSAKQTH